MYLHYINEHGTDAPGLQIPHNSLSPVFRFSKWKKIYWAQRYDRKCYNSINKGWRQD